MSNRIVTRELINRVYKAERVIYEWMFQKNISETTPELCMDILVANGIYRYDSKGRGHYFREDLRTLRDNNQLDTTFQRIMVRQVNPNHPWYIEIRVS